LSKKGIILAGGLGTRLFPLTRSVSKQLLPIYDKPMIYYPLSVLMKAGIKDVMVIATSEDVDRFQRLLGDGKSLGMTIGYTVQKAPTGLASAFILTEKFIGKDPVTLILGDNIFSGAQLDLLLTTIDFSTPGATVFAIEVEDPSKYGVVEKGATGKVVKLLEKPEVPPSNLAVTGLYFYDNQVVEIAKGLKPSARGELEITDLNNVYLQNHQLNVVILDSTVTWYDTGSFDTLLVASNFVKNEQERTGKLVGSIEVIAYQNGWIGKPELEHLELIFQSSGYGQKICVPS